jgi:hypothetical protein
MKIARFFLSPKKFCIEQNASSRYNSFNKLNTKLTYDSQDTLRQIMAATPYP